MFILLDKPKWWSSFDCIRFLREKTNIDKMGHGGTLDPFATGLMIIGTEKDTQKLEKTQNLDKKYKTTFKLGVTTESLDPEKDLQEFPEDPKPKEKEIKSVLKKFKQEYRQKPPKYSGVKVDGTPAYKLAREGKHFELSPKKVNLKSFAIQEYKYPYLKLEIYCSSGFYIRALARDLASELETHGMAEKLKRTKIGDYKLKKALTKGMIEEKEIGLKGKIYGKVQGVGFRAFTRKTARNLDIKGWVKNLPDGSVKVNAKGEIENIIEFKRQLNKGPRTAKVKKTKLHLLKPEKFNKFTIEY